MYSYFPFVTVFACSCLISIASGRNDGYEVWASDQSNSAPGEPSLGVKGGFLWIFDSDDIERQVKGKAVAKSLPCVPNQSEGPCNMLDVFPAANLQGEFANGTSAALPNPLPGFGRLHGVIADPQGMYVTANFFAPGGGYVGIINTRTKEAVGLFRVTLFNFLGGSGRSVHMSFWDDVDGSAIYIANLNGKAVERINVIRNVDDEITSLEFDRSASIGLGRNMSVAQEAVVFKGVNAFNSPLIGTIGGDYSAANLGDLTPNNVCKENGCVGSANGSRGGRPNNLPICPIAGANNLLYVTLAGGGLFVVNTTQTPMAILSEYGNQVIYGAGCGGVPSPDGQMWLNAGVAASAVGGNQSMFAVWALPPLQGLTFQPENMPEPKIVYEDNLTNTLTLGNLNGTKTIDTSGQRPGQSTRRDSHGMGLTTNGKYMHVADRVQNVMEVFDTENYKRFTYDLTSQDGEGHRRPGACLANSLDGFLLNDPAPDLFEPTPDGMYMMISLRGPFPVSVDHSSQGSCPGVGVVDLKAGGKRGSLVEVLRTTNTMNLENPKVVSVPGGNAYAGNERSDVHGTIVIAKTRSKKSSMIVV